MSSKTASKSYEHRGKSRNPVRNPGAPARKAAHKLDVRVRDYSSMVEKAGVKFKVGAFHRPGSRQR